jgi:hypothetical protein
MARTTGKSGFKMKSSPTKGKLGDFFGTLGERVQYQIKKTNDPTAYKEHMARKYGTGDYAASGSKSAERMKAGESKYQYDVRMKKQTSKVKKDTIDKKKKIDKKKQTTISTSEGFYFPASTSTSTSTSESKSKDLRYTFSGKKGDKYKYRVRGDKEYGDEGLYEFQYPKDHPKYKGPDHWEAPKSRSAEYEAIFDLWVGPEYEGRNVEITPIQKKSPYNKGISKKYTKRPKGSRGYKMKRK